jgi:ribosomal protein S18 acetylase RimI-like enzyme
LYAMLDSIRLRPATATDYSFALALYLRTMRPYTEELMVWDEQKQVVSFSRQWDVAAVQVICSGGRDVGWLQAMETPAEIVLQQFFVAPERQRAGIGSEVLRGLLAAWMSTGKPLALTVLKNNPARRLYERFGFSVVGEAGVKLQMRRCP